MKKENDIKKLHTFVICAYKEELHLEDCVKSLLAQNIKSNIYISTSTPNNFIKSIAEKYNIPLYINKKTKGHINDFNFAYDLAKTKYVTLCHQDDVYYPTFTEEILKKVKKHKNILILFSNYNECRNNKTVKMNVLLIIKRLINSLLILFKRSKKIRLFTLSLGNAICAPSVTYNKDLIDKPLIESDFKSNIDWITYIEFAKKSGEFIYITKALMEHRIHENSTTTKVINDDTKHKEDLIIFNMFWPQFIANILLRVYSTSEKSNNVKKEGEKNKMKIIMIAIYLILTVAGLILYKKGTTEDFLINITNKTVQIKLSLTSIFGLICYLCSFLIYMLILPKFDLTYIMPLMSAFSSISIYVLSILVLKESITIFGIIGTIIIVIGVLLINIKR